MQAMVSPEAGCDCGGIGAPPRRPRDLVPRDLGFTPQPAVQWFSPGVLLRSALHVGITSVFGSFLDKRELQSPQECVPDGRHRDEDELWFDYVADTGDGFAATATVATLVGRSSLAVPGVDRPLPRGRFLVFGGDEVYPMPESKGYDDRMIGPWTAALPWTTCDHPAAYAIPGNHDWMDGLTGFLRLFAQGDWIGGWRTRQTRSYFAVELPHNWWLWGIDIQSDAFIDRPQLDFFAGVAAAARERGERFGAPARLVLATAVPAWTEQAREPRAYQNLAYLERTVLEPSGIALRVIVAGDRHYYARYETASTAEDGGGGPARHLVTAGGGGAFLHPTHELPDAVTVPPADDQVAAGSAGYERKREYPGPLRSRGLSLQALLLPVRNPGFIPVVGVVCLALLWAAQFGLRSLERRGESFPEATAHWGWLDLAGGLFRSFPSVTLLFVVLAALVGFAQPPAWATQGTPKAVAKFVLALAHLALQVVAITTVFLVTLWAVSGLRDTGIWFGVAASLLVFAAGGLVSAFVVGLYLTLAVNLPGVPHANEAFAAARMTPYKNFLRLHIDTTGTLTLYAVGIDRVVERRDWVAAPDDGDDEAAWIVPGHDGPRIRLIERVTVE
jgi:hypothetical protein